MLTNLTEEQKNMVDDIKKEFISPLYRKINEEYAKESIEIIFRLCQLSKPTIYIVDSPMAGLKKIETLNKNDITRRKQIYTRQQIEHFVTKQEIIVRKQIADLVDDKIRELFRDNAGHFRGLISLGFLQHIVS